MTESSAIDAAALQQALQAGLERPLHVIHLPECGSTNRECQQRLTQDDDPSRLWLVSADRQSAGRGRRGRVWHSSRPDNLYCSFGFVTELPPSALGLLPLLTGVVLAEGLHAAGFGRVRLKWPNDLVIERRKLGGILIENRSLGGDRHALTVGFGLNLRLDEAARAAIGQPAASLDQEGILPSRQALLLHLLQGLLDELPAFEPSRAAALLQRFAALDAHAGDRVRVLAGERAWVGRCLGVDDQGRLRVEIDGREQCFSAAEISLRADEGDDDAAA